MYCSIKPWAMPSAAFWLYAHWVVLPFVLYTSGNELLGGSCRPSDKSTITQVMRATRNKGNNLPVFQNHTKVQGTPVPSWTLSKVALKQMKTLENQTKMMQVNPSQAISSAHGDVHSFDPDYFHKAAGSASSGSSWGHGSLVVLSMPQAPSSCVRGP